MIYLKIQIYFEIYFSRWICFYQLGKNITEECDMKKIIPAIILISLLSACVAQTENTVTETEANSITETSAEALSSEIISETEEQTEETSAPTEAETAASETEYALEFSSPEAEKYYNAIMSDTSWRKEETRGATIIDLDWDGSPEFVAVGNEHDCYALSDNGLEYLYSFGDYEFPGSMPVYNDGEEKKWWGMKSEYEHEENNDNSQRAGYRVSNKYGLIEFTESGPVMNAVLFENYEEYDSKTDIYKGEMYINGEHYASDHIEEYSQLDGVPGLEYYGWYTKKAEWEGENLSNDENYALPPDEQWWEQDTDISADICRLVNAYCENDKDYFTRDGYFGEVNAFKPVIYLYPEEKTDISVKLRLDGKLSCTYPEYENGWRVTAMPDGTLYDRRDGNEYSYLYWEGELNTDWDMSKGFVVKNENSADFLREKLSYMGLTPKEYNEFIVYWLPQLQSSRYNYITFQTDAYTNAAQLDISPEPDSVLRVFMVYMPLDEPFEACEQELYPFERSGFAAVEWGGALYK